MRITILFIFVAILTLASCHKDNGNYNYHVLNEIAITSNSDTLYIKQFDTLTVNPGISQDKPDTGRLVYSWYYFGADLAHPTPTQNISTSRVLHAQIGNIPGHYNLYLKVTDSTTGVSAYHAFMLIVTTSISEGWLALYDVGPDSSDAALILGSGQTLYNLYSNANLRHLSGQPRQIANFTAGWGKQYLFCLTSKEGDYISPLDFTRLVSFDSAFYGPPPVRDYQAILPNTEGDFVVDCLVNGGKVYTRTWQGPFSLPKYGAALAGDYVAAPYVLGSPYYNFGPYPSVFYDETHHKFMYVSGVTSGFTLFPDNDTAAFNLNDMGNKTMKFAYSSPTGQATVLMKNNADDSCFVYTMDFTAASPEGTKKAVAGSPAMAGATLFDISPTLPMIYYAVGGALYKYDIQANTSALLYTFPAGATITALKMLNPPRPARYSPVNLGKRLAVGVYDGTAGSVYEFGITPTGAFEGSSYLGSHTGFGRISSLFYKLQL